MVSMRFFLALFDSNVFCLLPTIVILSAVETRGGLRPWRRLRGRVVLERLGSLQTVFARFTNIKLLYVWVFARLNRSKIPLV